MVLREVVEVSDKVWHNELKYKAITLQLMDRLTKLVCTFTIDNYTRRPFKTQSGVSQGNSLSPTLYSLYVSYIPHHRKAALI